MSNVVCIYHGSQTILFLATKYMKCQQIYIGAPSVTNLILYHYWEIDCLQNCGELILMIRNHCPAGVCAAPFTWRIPSMGRYSENNFIKIICKVNVSLLPA